MPSLRGIFPMGNGKDRIAAGDPADVATVFSFPSPCAAMPLWISAEKRGGDLLRVARTATGVPVLSGCAKRTRDSQVVTTATDDLL